jgi:hypothetical protein
MEEAGGSVNDTRSCIRIGAASGFAVDERQRGREKRLGRRTWRLETAVLRPTRGYAARLTM